jgi:23S rRNA-/tRNA-specific pseudouridylate synthase
VHQLDKETSGVNLFVRRKALVEQWSALLKHQGQKEYLALCHGAPTWERRRCRARLGWLPGQRRRGVVQQGGQEAETLFERLEVGQGASLLRALPRTGRTHQIRLHLEALGHGLLGDKRYGDQAPCGLHARHALHAASLRAGGRQWRAPLPPRPAGAGPARGSETFLKRLRPPWRAPTLALQPRDDDLDARCGGGFQA